MEAQWKVTDMPMSPGYQLLPDSVRKAWNSSMEPSGETKLASALTLTSGLLSCERTNSCCFTPSCFLSFSKEDMRNEHSGDWCDAVG